MIQTGHQNAGPSERSRAAGRPAQNMGENILEIKGLSKSYKEFTLADIDLLLPGGYIMGVIGENGAGKSTLIKSVLGITRKDAGTVVLFGETLKENEDAVKNRIGVVLGELNLPDSFRGKEIDIMMGRIYKNWSSETYFAYLERFAIDRNKKIKEYSKGMKVKAAMAIALSHEAELLILDEPANGLDPVAREDVMDILRDFVQDERHSVLISSHIISDLEKVSDYVTFLHNGKILLSETRDRLLEEYKLIKGSAARIRALSDEGAIRVAALTENRFGAEALVSHVKPGLLLGDCILENSGLEEIMLYLLKGEQNERINL